MSRLASSIYIKNDLTFSFQPKCVTARWCQWTMVFRNAIHIIVSRSSIVMMHNNRTHIKLNTKYVLPGFCINGAFYQMNVSLNVCICQVKVTSSHKRWALWVSEPSSKLGSLHVTHVSNFMHFYVSGKIDM